MPLAKSGDFTGFGEFQTQRMMNVRSKCVDSDRTVLNRVEKDLALGLKLRQQVEVPDVAR